MDEKNNARRRTPAQVNRRLQGNLLSWLFTGVLVAVLVASILFPDRAYSQGEGRELTAFPRITLSSMLDGSYLVELGDWFADQFPGRDSWRSMNALINRFLGRRELDGVYLGSDGSLLPVPAQWSADRVDSTLEAVESFASAYPQVNMVLTLVPGASAIHTDKLPSYAPPVEWQEASDYVADGLSRVHYQDITDVLLEHGEEYLYFKTEPHWTSLGAKYGFYALAPALNITPVEEEAYVRYNVSNSFRGELAARWGGHREPDTVEIYTPKTGIDYYVTYNGGGKNVSSLYQRSALSGGDHYDVFLGGDWARVDVTTGADTGRSLLILRDGSAGPLVQFLYPYFDHITLLDPRLFYGNVELVMKTESITDVLFVYDADTFLGDPFLADVLAGG